MASSESVWLRQIDSALLELFRGIMSDDVNVLIRKPDMDFNKESFPCVSIFNLGYNRDPLRDYPFLVTVGRDDENIRLTRERGAIPYNMHYQIDFWTTLLEDMNRITLKWLSNIPEGYLNLEARDVSGNPHSLFMRMENNISRADEVEGNKRLFRATFDIKIWTEIDERVQSSVPYIKEVIIKVNE